MNYIEEQRYDGSTEIKICATIVPHPQAQFAMELMRHLAIAAGAPDGEDTAGRSKLRLMTPAEVVNRATDIAEAAYGEFRARGWLLDLPIPKPAIREEYDSRTRADRARAKLDALIAVQEEQKALESLERLTKPQDVLGTVPGEAAP